MTAVTLKKFKENPKLVLDLVIAITFWDYDVFRSAISRLSISRLDWGREIMSIHKWMTKPTNVYYDSLEDAKPFAKIVATSTVTIRNVW